MRKGEIMSIINSVQSCKTAISAIKRSGAKIDTLIQATCLFALAHYSGEGKGDTSLLTNLINAMPKSGRTNALKYYMTAHANITWVQDEKGGRFKKVEKAEHAVSTVPTVPFWEFKKDTEQSDFNQARLIGSIKGVITRITNSIKAGHVPAEEMATMQATSTKLQEIVDGMAVGVMPEAESSEAEIEAVLKAA